MKNFVSMITDICKDKNILMLGLLNDWLIQLRKDNKTALIVKNTLPVNEAATVALCEDKYMLNNFLQHKEIPCLPYSVYTGDNTSEISTILDELVAMQSKVGDIVIKPNIGSHGKGVHLLHAEEPITYEVNDALRFGEYVVASPYIEIEEEYRLIVLGDAIRLIYRKDRPYIIGDGEHTIAELLLSKTGSYVQSGNTKQKGQMDYVPKKGKAVRLEWRHNLHYGSSATVIPITDIDSDILELAWQTAKETGVAFAAIDIIECEDSYKVLSVNCSPSCNILLGRGDGDTRKLVHDIYADAIDMIFSVK